jgi:serine/threonine protein kinase
MTPESWRKVKELFETALKLDPDAREPFLTRACEGDKQFREEVVSLLSSHAESSHFLELPAAAVMAESLIDDQATIVAGRHISNFEIVSKIAEGGMGEVYLARDLTSERKVAIKLIRREYKDQQEQLRYFKREARAISALHHRNLCTLYEIGTLEDGQPFIAMEYVEGRSLSDYVKSWPHETSEVIDIAIQTAEALYEAHVHGIIHRDIKPSNIMITPSGTVKVLDFGLARIAIASSDQVCSDASTAIKTASGVILGTIFYMSPEQALGEDVDHRTDIFSLGAVLYEMLTGKRPFTGQTFGKTLEKIARGQVDPMTLLQSKDSAEFERIVMKCLSRDKRMRYESAYDLLLDLENLRKTVAMHTGHYR